MMVTVPTTALKKQRDHDQQERDKQGEPFPIMILFHSSYLPSLFKPFYQASILFLGRQPAHLAFFFGMTPPFVFKRI